MQTGVKKPTVEVVRETGWDRAYAAALRTQGKDSKGKTPTDKWVVRSIMAEHSQIKLVEYRISFKDLRQWVGVHLLRHPFVLPFIHSQRSDRDAERMNEAVDKVMSIIEDDVKNDPDFNMRDYRFQGEGNDQDFYVNAQTLVNISRKRLCTTASRETRYAWAIVKNAIKEFDPMMAHCMVRQCVYRGFCPEMHPACQYWRTEQFTKELETYRSVAPSYEAYLKEKEANDD